MGINNMRIIDNFLFHNEFDLLEIRLSTHYDYVDQFTIVECNHTFTGIHKGFNLIEQKERYAPWWDKVKLVQPDRPPHNDSWNAEHWMRNHFQTQWDNLTKDDVVIIADLDEIIRPEALQFIRETDYDFYKLGMPFFNLKFNYLNLVPHNPWPSVKAFRGYYVEGMDGMRNVHSVPGGRQVDLHHSGWHFSYLGDEEYCRNKLRSFSHSEWNLPHITDNFNVSKAIENGQDILARPGFVFCPVKLDNYFPKYIIDNKEKFKNYILQDGEKSVLDHIPGNVPQVLSVF